MSDKEDVGGGYRVIEVVSEGYLQMSPQDALSVVLQSPELLKQLKAALADLPDED